MTRVLVLGALGWLALSSGVACGPREAGGHGIGMLPGAEPFPEELARRLSQALAAKGEGYVGRTRHRDDDGTPIYTNRLLLETSPYLLQHAHNPVSWYPWGDEAFDTARRLGRPVLLSVGYSTCHWCHVMEEESFEDEEIAAFLNASYVAIKVDREERPDVDGIYMTAVQMLTGGGGWPMTVWLTPDRRPYYGGTYFPARDGDRGTRRGFLTLLRDLKSAYDATPDRVADQARQIAERIRAAMAPEAGPATDAEASLASAVRTYRATFDPQHGGRRGAPKFPSNLPIRLLLWRHRRTGDPELLRMAELTLREMARGGIYDQIGGGFHRYSTDGGWGVPHFEKMLYDNALLAVAYLEGYQATGEGSFARVAREILRYVAREMTSPDGAFFSATDADSRNAKGEVEEGWYFTWTPAEIRAVLGEDEARKFAAYYGVTAAGNLAGRNVLHVERPLEEVAALLGMPADRLAAELEAARSKLYAARLLRAAPLRDEKVIAAWNGLTISAMARSGFVLADADALARARRAAEFVLGRMRPDGRLCRSFSGGQARHAAYLEDYAFVIAGLLDLYESTAEARWLAAAVELQAQLDEHYRDPAGGYFMTGDDHETLIAREKPAYDGAEPSGNSVALMNLSRLAVWTGDARYDEGMAKLRSAFAGTLGRRPTSVAEMLLALEFALGGPLEVAVVAPDSVAEAAPFVEVLRRTFVPNKVFAVVTESAARAQGGRVPLLRDKIARGGRTTGYVCHRGVCKLPTTDIEVFGRQLTRAVGPAEVAPSAGD